MDCFLSLSYLLAACLEYCFKVIVMGKSLLEITNIIALSTIVAIPFLKTRGIGRYLLSVITLQVVIAFALAVIVFTQGTVFYVYEGSITTGKIPVKVDFLSAWFIALISFTFLTGTWYGVHYLKKYSEQTDNLRLHAVTLVLTLTALIDICVVQNTLVFLVVWEIMAVGSFMLIIFEHYKTETLKAGINFLIQSHVSILILTLSFIWVKAKTGSFEFDAISGYTAVHPAIGIGLFAFLFIGFAIKAGFVPFHTWLPLAHPAAPAHISGIMSGVIIKIGIFGILRMLTLIKTDFTIIGYFVLFISVISGVYGVMLAIVQHNLKRLLAYHSIENIGIIGIGIGIGCLGIGNGNNYLYIAGFGGALLHTLNHSLFKSLLFFTAGNVYQATHTMNIESLGGVIKEMPRTSYLFLFASLAICGLPPFNGFVSEFFIYSGLFKGLISSHFLSTLALLFVIVALALIGGLALLCFTKAFGIVFLGNNRNGLSSAKTDEMPLSVYPLYPIALLMLVIGVFPFLFSPALLKITGLFQPGLPADTRLFLSGTIDNISLIGWYSLGFAGLAALLLLFRKWMARNKAVREDCTWGCGYVGMAEKTQYTASSFVRTYRKLIEPLLFIKKEKKTAQGLYPDALMQTTHPHDHLENLLIDKPVYAFKKLLNRFVFLQNGNIQSYILYGFIFITVAFVLPFLYSKIIAFIHFINQI